MKIRKELIAGIVTVIAIVGFWMLFQFLKGRNIFTSDNIYYANYDNVAGLLPSRPIYINGLKVGMVGSIKPYTTKGTDTKFIVEMKVSKKYRFSKNSIAEIETSLMAGTSVRISLANDNLIAKEKDTIKGSLLVSSVDVAMSKLDPISGDIGNVLKKLDSTLVKTNQILNETNQKNIASILENLDKTIIDFRTLAKNSNNLISANTSKISQTISNTNSTIEKYSAFADKLNQTDFSGTISNLNKSIKDLNTITSNLNTGKGSLGKLMTDESMYKNLNNASVNLSSLLEDLKRNPKKYVHFSIFGRSNNNKEENDTPKQNSSLESDEPTKSK